MKNKIIYTVFKDTDREFSGNKKEIAEHFNIKYKTLQYRIKNFNLTIEKAIDFKKYDKTMKFKNNNKNNNNNSKFKVYTVFKDKIDKDTGKSLEFTGNMNQISKYFNISYNSLKYRIEKLNLSVDEAISYNSKNYKNNKNINANKYTVFKGKIDEKTGENLEFIGTLPEIAKHYNINYTTLRYRINKLNLSIEEAINFNKYSKIKDKDGNLINLNNNNNNNFIKYIIYNKESNEKEFEGTLRQIAIHYNVKYNSLYSAMRRHNFTVQETLDFLKRNNKKNKKEK